MLWIASSLSGARPRDLRATAFSAGDHFHLRGGFRAGGAAGLCTLAMLRFSQAAFWLVSVRRFHLDRQWLSAER